MRHTISVISDGRPYSIKVYCSCGETLFENGSGLDLDQIADLADQHIRSVETGTVPPR